MLIVREEIEVGAHKEIFDTIVAFKKRSGGKIVVLDKIHRLLAPHVDRVGVHRVRGEAHLEPGIVEARPDNLMIQIK